MAKIIATTSSSSPLSIRGTEEFASNDRFPSWQFSNTSRGPIASLDARVISPAERHASAVARLLRVGGSGGVASIHTRGLDTSRRVASVRLTPAEAALSREHIHPTTLNESVSTRSSTRPARCSLAPLGGYIRRRISGRGRSSIGGGSVSRFRFVGPTTLFVRTLWAVF